MKRASGAVSNIVNDEKKRYESGFACLVLQKTK